MCGLCIQSCPNDAINNEFHVITQKCIGCSKCLAVCSNFAISMEEHDVDISKVLPELVSEGVDFLELHIMGHDKNDLETKWNIINSCRPKYASICIDRENFGNKECIERIKNMISI